ncbi:hypothetical protein R8Z50_19440 [Longispora sp. K20-0274]|uniref:hypothetical protein n=1 Tax=Longispora sp. K20-0274 TaxID=3088255 RepID=UPI00399BDF2C
MEETASAALEWAGVLCGQPRRAAARALLDGYRAAGGTLTVPGPEVFAGWLVKRANWTEMHVRHALDDGLSPARRRAAGAAVPGLLAQLRRLTSGITTWSGWLA